MHCRVGHLHARIAPQAASALRIMAQSKLLRNLRHRAADSVANSAAAPPSDAMAFGASSVPSASARLMGELLHVDDPVAGVDDEPPMRTLLASGDDMGLPGHEPLVRSRSFLEAFRLNEENEPVTVEDERVPAPPAPPAARVQQNAFVEHPPLRTARNDSMPHLVDDGTSVPIAAATATAMQRASGDSPNNQAQRRKDRATRAREKEECARLRDERARAREARVRTREAREARKETRRKRNEARGIDLEPELDNETPEVPVDTKPLHPDLATSVGPSALDFDALAPLQLPPLSQDAALSPGLDAPLLSEPAPPRPPSVQSAVVPVTRSEPPVRPAFMTDAGGSPRMQLFNYDVTRLTINAYIMYRGAFLMLRRVWRWEQPWISGGIAAFYLVVWWRGQLLSMLFLCTFFYVATFRLFQPPPEETIASRAFEVGSNLRRTSSISSLVSLRSTTGGSLGQPQQYSQATYQQLGDQVLIVTHHLANLFERTKNFALWRNPWATARYLGWILLFAVLSIHMTTWMFVKLPGLFVFFCFFGLAPLVEHGYWRRVLDVYSDMHNMPRFNGQTNSVLEYVLYGVPNDEEHYRYGLSRSLWERDHEQRRRGIHNDQGPNMIVGVYDIPTDEGVKRRRAPRKIPQRYSDAVDVIDDPAVLAESLEEFKPETTSNDAAVVPNEHIQVEQVTEAPLQHAPLDYVPIKQESPEVPNTFSMHAAAEPAEPEPVQDASFHSAEKSPSFPPRPVLGDSPDIFSPKEPAVLWSGASRPREPSPFHSPKRREPVFEPLMTPESASIPLSVPSSAPVRHSSPGYHTIRHQASHNQFGAPAFVPAQSDTLRSQLERRKRIKDHKKETLANVRQQDSTLFSRIADPSPALSDDTLAPVPAQEPLKSPEPRVAASSIPVPVKTQRIRWTDEKQTQFLAVHRRRLGHLVVLPTRVVFVLTHSAIKPIVAASDMTPAEESMLTKILDGRYYYPIIAPSVLEDLVSVEQQGGPLTPFEPFTVLGSTNPVTAQVLFDIPVSNISGLRKTRKSTPVLDNCVEGIEILTGEQSFALPAVLQRDLAFQTIVELAPRRWGS